MQSTPPAQPRRYGAAQARFIMKLADECAGGFDFLEFRENAEVPGVFMSEPYADAFPSGARGIEAGRLLAWNPAVDLENGPDPATWPLLPAEFTARDLAAFLVYGVGTFIHDVLRPAGAFDEAALENVGGSRDEWARQALREAYELAGRAQAVVGPLDDEAERKAHLIGEQLDKENGQANERERVFEPGIPADEANARRARAKASVARLEKEFEELTAEATQKRERWRKAMMRALFEVEDAQQAETSAPTPEPARVLPVAAPLGRQRHQESEILRVLREMGYDPMHLPPRAAGKPGLRAEVRAKLKNMTEHVFTKAWGRLRKYKEIRGGE